MVVFSSENGLYQAHTGLATGEQVMLTWTHSIKAWTLASAVLEDLDIGDYILPSCFTTRVATMVDALAFLVRALF